MGYCMTLRDVNFSIKKENFKFVLDEISALMNKTDKMGGGSSKGERWFAWVDTNEVNECLKEGNKPGLEASALDKVFQEWRWSVTFDDNGDIDSIGFDGEKLGDDTELFNAIAPFVNSRSFIEMVGEDGAIWRWVFKYGKCFEKYAKINWE